ncbi:MAG: hypothetical protein F4Y55_08070 [Gammaproteobacteria bacterium]|nr:hypothetical protein [Gammaproteobacteria bacterium]
MLRRAINLPISTSTTYGDSRHAAETGVADVEHLTETLGVGGGCGTCLEVAESIIDACRVNQLSYAA